MNKIDKYLKSQKGLTMFKKLYGNSKERISAEVERYTNLCNTFVHKFNSEEYILFNNPGRTELSGNHTDHNHGLVLAGSVNLDIIAAAKPNGSNIVKIYDIQYNEIVEINLDNTEPLNEEKEKPEALIRGIAAAFIKKGYTAKGFDAVIHSEVMSGSGLSSSAALEIMIANIYNILFNSGRITEIELAQAGQFAENNYFGKPCGLMDQIACAYGGIVGIDFKDPKKPKVNQVSFSLQEYGFSLLITETGGSHADLTNEYSSIPIEMEQIAGFYGKKVCRDIKYSRFIEDARQIRTKFGDRAFLRVIHFIKENERVTKQLETIRNNNIDEFLNLVNQSGTSSWKYLQNITPSGEILHQGMAVTLAVTEQFIAETGKGAVRVHGGGFAGTILAIIPTTATEKYISYMKTVSPDSLVRVLNIRKIGAITIPLE